MADTHNDTRTGAATDAEAPRALPAPNLALLRLAFRHGTRFLRADAAGGVYTPFKTGERQAFRHGLEQPGFLAGFALVTDDYGASRWEATPTAGGHVRFNSLSVAELLFKPC